ncbi:MAG: hypothetical protein OK404_00900 [Thaumarchaeota archaeon]|nr:hypothetical protein [Nitrososphaerota archaeon]
MDLKPASGLKVKVNAKREAVFGDESLAVQKTTLNDGHKSGVLTGVTLAGFCEVDMPTLDGRKHWYPIEDLEGEHGEKIVEEEIPIKLDQEESEETEEAEEEPA